MIGQRILLAIAAAAGLVAGSLYYASVQRTGVVVAAHDLDADKAIRPDDVALRELPPEVIPAGAVRSVDAAIGLVPRAPLFAGQLVLGPGLADGAAAFHSGLVPPAGQRAIAIPVTPGQALGGAIVAGAHVDVIAVPIAGRAPASRVTEVVAVNVTVLDVRAENGTAFVAAAGRPGATVVDRLGSVVVALPPADEVRVADRVATSTFVLVFIPIRQ